MVHDFAGSGTAREGVVGDAAGNGATFGEVAVVLPAEGDAGLSHRGVSASSWTLEDAYQVLWGCGDCSWSPLTALRGRPMPGSPGDEDDAAVGVVPSVGLVLAHEGELDAVDGQELVEDQAEDHGGEDIDFDQGTAASVLGTEGVLPPPFGGGGGEAV